MRTPDLIYDTMEAPPVDRIDRRYSLDEIRYSPSVRMLMPSIDLNTINFETGSWEIPPDQAAKLQVIADGLNRAIARNPREVFLIEGHTDAVGNDVDNLSLSDRRAESAAELLTQQFDVPAENLTSQGYGSQYPKEQTDGPSRINRRVTVRRITPLLNGGTASLPPPPPAHAAAVSVHNAKWPGAIPAIFIMVPSPLVVPAKAGHDHRLESGMLGDPVCHNNVRCGYAPDLRSLMLACPGRRTESAPVSSVLVAFELEDVGAFADR